MEIDIVDASIRLLYELYEIEKQCFKIEAFSKQQIAYLLTGYNVISLAARVNGEIAGFIIGQIDIENNLPIGHILTIDVAPRHHRKGIAQQLLREIEDIFKAKGIKECRLEVREDNAAALNLYLKAGYKKVAKLENYYPNAHGLCLVKNLF
jgi:ribosomal-protein-alanine acetyltransferase